jgi:predicted Fe-Mo cluster-binding NifX family protein
VSSTTIVCVPVAGDGRIDPRWGRADRVAIAELTDGRIDGWREYDVGWGIQHDEGSEGSHHARVARFLRDQHVQVVLAHHMGPDMAHMLERMGIRIHLGAAGLARDSVVRLAQDE